MADMDPDSLDEKDVAAKTAKEVSASEVETPLKPSSTTKARESTHMSQDGKKDLAEKDGNRVGGSQRDTEEATNAEPASLVKIHSSTADDDINEATKEQLNQSERTGPTVEETNNNMESEVVDKQEKENISPSPSAKRKLDADFESRNEAIEEASQADISSDKNSADAKPGAALPKRPIKRARTAYFIFTDEKRPEVQAAHPGEGVAAVAKALGQLWGSLSAEEKKVYQDRAAKERERVSQELEAYKAAGGNHIDSPSIKVKDPLATILPVARIRKICKLDPEVRGLSKEALFLVTKCTELMLQKLGKETVKIAQLQNRRKLLPDDVANVCAHREQFLFLKDDVQDLVRSMESSSDGKPGGAKKVDTAKQAAAAGTKKLTSYFSAPK